LKKTLNHLPVEKREQVEAALALILSRAQMEMLVLFGSHTRSDWAEDLESGYLSDMDFLVVVEWPEEVKGEKWTLLQQELAERFPATRVSLLVEDVRRVNHEIRAGQFFYGDIVNDGVLLLGSRRYELAKPKARDAQQRYESTLKYFDYWFRTASEFWHGSVYYAGRKQNATAAFSLHQAAERYLHGALLVYQGYKPKSHDLKALSEHTAPFHSALAGALPRTEPADQHHFDLLRRAYIEARYSASYTVTTEELAAMREMVLDLAARMRTACAAQLEKMAPAGELAELAAIPNIDESLTFPENFDLTDRNALKNWKAAVTSQAFQKGHEAGKEEGLIEGLRRGRDEGLQLGEQRGLERGVQIGIERGIERGVQIGIERGRDEGLQLGEQRGIERGVQIGIERGVQIGIERGVQIGIERGIERGRDEGLQLGEQRGIERGVQIGIERGIERGRDEGLRLGEQRGIERGRDEGRLEERARAVVEVLRHRGVTTTNQQEERLLACRDGDTLERWWSRVWTVSSVDELLG
jgi:flagellar biosynthesis/type III secretory pathway protein FliH/HEPN domain-containing protein/predicted nucleotidyltransferase